MQGTRGLYHNEEGVRSINTEKFYQVGFGEALQQSSTANNDGIIAGGVILKSIEDVTLCPKSLDEKDRFLRGNGSGLFSRGWNDCVKYNSR